MQLRDFEVDLLFVYFELEDSGEREEVEELVGNRVGVTQHQSEGWKLDVGVLICSSLVVLCEAVADDRVL